jgi:hypothetical protein
VGGARMDWGRAWVSMVAMKRSKMRRARPQGHLEKSAIERIR